MSRRDFVVSPLALAAITSASEAKEQHSPFVHAKGRELVDGAGKPLFLRGINLGNWLVQEGYMFLFEDGPQSTREIEAFANELIGPAHAVRFWKEYRRTYITEADIQLIAKSGLNSVRIPFHYKFFHDSTEGFDLLEPVLDVCRRAQLWVILDMHCAPGGQTGTNIDDSWGYPWLYESEEHQQLTCDIWRRIAERYRNESIICGYDLLNEPIPHYPSLLKYNSKLEPLYRRITAAIREVDPNHLIILGGAQWDSNFKVFGEPFDSNLLYQLHKYWMPPAQASVAEYIDFRNRYSVPVWLGESGENTDDWIRQFRTLLDKNNIGWCFWPYKKLEKTSCMASVKKPMHWDEIVSFAKMAAGTGNAEKRVAARPSIEIAQAAFDDLLKKIRLAQCQLNEGFFGALGLRS